MKKSIIPVAAFIAGMAIVPSVSATENTATIQGAGDLVKCITEQDKSTCAYGGEDDFLLDGADVAVNRDVTIDLGGKKLTVNNITKDTGAFRVAEGKTLTIVNGSIDGTGATYPILGVEKGGSLVLSANLNAKQPIIATEPEKIVINGNVTSTAANAALKVNGSTGFASTASIVEVNGRLDAANANAYAYTQTGNVNATFNGNVVNNTLGNAVYANGGKVALNNARIHSDEKSAVVLAGEGGELTVECSELTSRDYAALFVKSGAVVEALTIKNSALKSTNKSAIDGDGASSKIKTVKIDGSRFEAKKGEKVMAGTTTFDKAYYDGELAAEDADVLSAAKGSYGTLAACDASAADEGEEDNKDDGTTNPNTADTIATYLTIATVALLGLGATAFVAKKSNR